MGSQLRRALTLLAVMTASIVADQLTKLIARSTLPGSGVHSVVGSFMVLVYTENRGGFLSLGSSWPEPIRVAVLVVISAVFLALLIGYAIKGTSHSVGRIVAFGLIAGGGFGNLIDRIFRNGYVVDFLNFGIGRLRTGILNVADLAVSTGVVVLIIFFLRKDGSDATSASSEI